MKARLIRQSIAVWLLCFSCAVYAVTPPVEFLESVANRVIQALNKSKGRLNEHVAYNIVNNIMLPHVDVTGMARSVLGRDAWNKASGSEQNQFSQEFTKLVVRTYSKALAKYTNERIQFYPIREDWQNQSRVQVRSIVRRSSGPSIPISYRLIKRGASWKVYDLSVEGVSLVASYRTQFANEIRSGSMSSLIQKLRKNNAK